MFTTHRVIISKQADVALRKQFKYIGVEQKEPELAKKWLSGMKAAIASLAEFLERCSVTPESSSDSEIITRHLIYKKSFRIIFTIEKNKVKIINVRHAARLHN